MGEWMRFVRREERLIGRDGMGWDGMDADLPGTILQYCTYISLDRTSAFGQSIGGLHRIWSRSFFWFVRVCVSSDIQCLRPIDLVCRVYVTRLLGCARPVDFRRT